VCIAQTDIHISEIVPVGQINPTERLVRYARTFRLASLILSHPRYTLHTLRFQVNNSNQLFVMVR
jgi:hypothetical protein